ncbi:MAG: DNA gyrase subunit A [Candidatus Paceibacterota bacterium]
MPEKKNSNTHDEGSDDGQQLTPEQVEEAKHVISASITSEMKDSYLDYAMSVITSRALPDVKDGLKPVQRRILYAMHTMNLTAGGKFRKSAAIVGEVLGNYHPHGDSSVYAAMVNLAQPWSMRYPLVWGQGNFGSIDDDPPAAQRYTEAKMTKIAGEMLSDIEKSTVDFRSNYDGTKKEPIVLPASVPNLLLNGTLGIAVGMATNIPPHNLEEVIDATTHLIDTPKATNEDILDFIKGPDFPTGGLAFNEADIHHACATGKGGVVVRGEAEIVEGEKGSHQIIITSVPYRTNKADLIIKIADLVRNKKIEGIKDLRDESTDEIRVVVDLKGGGHPQNILNNIYKYTQLEDTFHYNVVTLVDGIPQTLSIKGVLEQFIGHRVDVVTRRTKHDLAKAEAREHILIGLKKALDHIDEIIKLIKKSKDTQTAHANLMKEFKFSDRQATAILEMRLQKLAGLERQRIEDELAEVQKLIAELKEILSSEKKIRTVIKNELAEMKKQYGDERRTKIIKSGVKSMSVEDLIPDEESTLVLTAGGYIKRMSPDQFKKQKRGGVGVVDIATKEDDFVHTFLTANTHNDLLFFTDAGKVYQTKMYDVPEGKRATRGKSVMNFLPLEGEERITTVLPMPKEVKKSDDLSVLMMTKQGVSKRVKAENFYDVRRSGLIAMKLGDNDQLIKADFVNAGDDVIAVSAHGQAIRFSAKDIREMGRSAAGVRGMKIGKGDYLIGAQVIKADAHEPGLLVLTASGYGKITDASEYKRQKRGGSGIKSAKVTGKTGNVIAVRVVTEEEELVVMSKKSQVIRTGLSEIPHLGRVSQGVRIMKLRENDEIASVICL